MADVFVRPARLIDAGGFAAVQRQSWMAASADLGLPALPDADVMERSWERAVMAPPTERHHTWVAVETSSGTEVVVGAAALAPASDPDLETGHCLELLLFTVDPAHRGRGHGSRLLAAALQTGTTAGEREAVVWLATNDDALRSFLEAAGWAADGAHRTLATDDDLSQLRQVRLGTLIEAPA